MESSQSQTSATPHETAPLALATADTSVHTTSLSGQFFASFADPEYRHAYADEHLNTFIPLQIRTIREQRGWTQGELGERCGNKAQGWISKLEDPNYGRFTLATLRSLARAFDCMLEVRFRSFRDYSDEQDRRRPGDTRVNTYDEDATLHPVTGGVTATDATSSLIEVVSSVTSGKLKMAKAYLDFMEHETSAEAVNGR